MATLPVSHDRPLCWTAMWTDSEMFKKNEWACGFAKFTLCKWLQWHSPVWVAHQARLMCHPLGRFVALKLSCSGAVIKLHYAWGVPVNTTTHTTHEGPTSTLAITMPSPIPPPHVFHERKKEIAQSSTARTFWQVALAWPASKESKNTGTVIFVLPLGSSAKYGEPWELLMGNYASAKRMHIN